VSEVGKFADKLAALGEPAFLERLARGMAERTLDLVDQGYQQRQDPYGMRWTTTKQKNPILERTGYFRSGWGIRRADSRGFTISSAAEYGEYHQTGTRRMVARKTVPEGDSLGIWEAPLDQAVVDMIVEALK
jgi:hypothetical protein